MSEVYIPVVLGTAREGRRSEAVAKYVHDIVSATESVRTELVDVRDHLMEATVNDSAESELADKWRAIADEADGFVLVSPEYNHSFPGELKMLIDRAFPEYKHKVFGVCGVSNGPWGGIRMAETIRSVLITLNAVVSNRTVMFSNVNELFDEGGNITDESYTEKVEGLMEDVVWYAQALKTAREAA